MAITAEIPADPERPARLRIADQNDIFRRSYGFAAQWNGQPLEGRVVTTPGFLALSDYLQAMLLLEVGRFNDFNADNDMWEDHSFGIVTVDSVSIYWKIDLFDTAYNFGAATPEDATDPEKTRRVLTLYLPSEH